MSILSKQIGWSQESNLIYEIIKQLNKLNNVVAATAGGGVLNPTTSYIPYNSGLTFSDSYLVNDTANSVLKSVYSSNDKGIKLDFANDNYLLGYGSSIGDMFIKGVGVRRQSSTKPIIYIGDTDIDVPGNLTNLEINDFNQLIKTQNQGSDVGLKIDFANNVYLFGQITSDYVSTLGLAIDNSKFALGDIGNVWSKTYLEIDSDAGYIKSCSLGNDIGLKLDFANNQYFLGDFDEVNQGTRIIIDASSEIIKTKNSSNDIGLKLDFAAGAYNLGDFNSIINSTYLTIDDANQQWVMSTNLKETVTPSGPSGDYLVVYINNTKYYINLLQP